MYLPEIDMYDRPHEKGDPFCVDGHIYLSDTIIFKQEIVRISILFELSMLAFSGLHCISGLV